MKKPLPIAETADLCHCIERQVRCIVKHLARVRRPPGLDGNLHLSQRDMAVLRAVWMSHGLVV